MRPAPFHSKSNEGNLPSCCLQSCYLSITHDCGCGGDLLEHTTQGSTPTQGTAALPPFLGTPLHVAKPSVPSTHPPGLPLKLSTTQPHACPAPLHPCCVLCLACFCPSLKADVYFFKNKFTLLQERFIWWLCRARQHGHRENADTSLLFFHRGDRGERGSQGWAKSLERAEVCCAACNTGSLPFFG